MRVKPNLRRLRAVALGSWVCGGLLLMKAGHLAIMAITPQALVISVGLLALLAFAVGVAFWQLSADKRAGIVLDAKGLLLNLGASSAFIAWENIERLGVCRGRSSLLALGSLKQLGIALRDVGPYVQSYEMRLPASDGLMARGLRLIERLMRPLRPQNDEPLEASIQRNRARLGYDVLVPEALLGCSVESFIELMETYRRRTGAPSSTRQLAIA